VQRQTDATAFGRVNAIIAIAFALDLAALALAQKPYHHGNNHLLRQRSPGHGEQNDRRPHCAVHN
jgi:hypothetical protein